MSGEENPSEKNVKLYARDARSRMEAHLEAYLQRLKQEDVSEALKHLSAIVRASEYENRKLMSSLEELKAEAAGLMYAEAVLYELSKGGSASQRLAGQYEFLKRHPEARSSILSLLSQQASTLLAKGAASKASYDRSIQVPGSSAALHRPKICLILPAFLSSETEAWLHHCIKQIRASFRLSVIGTPNVVEHFIGTEQLSVACEWVEPLSFDSGFEAMLQRMEILLVQSGIHSLMHVSRLCNPLSSLARGFFPQFFHLALEIDEATASYHVDLLIGKKEQSWYSNAAFTPAPLALNPLLEEETLKDPPKEKGITLTSSLPDKKLRKLLRYLQEGLPEKQRVPFVFSTEQRHSYTHCCSDESTYTLIHDDRYSVHLIVGPLEDMSLLLEAVQDGQEVWWYCEGSWFGHYVPDDFKATELSPCTILSEREQLKKRIETVKNRKYRLDKDVCKNLYTSLQKRSKSEFQKLARAMEEEYYSFLARKGIELIESPKEIKSEKAVESVQASQPDPMMQVRFDHPGEQTNHEESDSDQTERAHTKKNGIEQLSRESFLEGLDEDGLKPAEHLESPEASSFAQDVSLQKEVSHLDELLLIGDRIDDYRTPFLYTLIQELSSWYQVRLLCVDYLGSDIPESNVYKVPALYTDSGTVAPPFEKRLQRLKEEFVFRAVYVYHPRCPELLDVVANNCHHSRLLCELSDKHYYRIKHHADDWKVALRDRCDHVLVSSERLQQLHSEIHIPPTTLIHSPPAVRMNVRSIASHQTSTKVISAISFERHHAPFLILKAFESAQKEYEDLTLELIGSGSLIDAMQQNLARSQCKEGSVTITETENYRYLYEALETADIFFNHPVPDPGSDETPPVSFPLVQAMSYGMGIVSTTLSSIQEILTHGKNALLIEPFDVEHAAEALLSLSNDDQGRLSLGKHARKQAAEHHDVEQRCSMILELIGASPEEELDAAQSTIAIANDTPSAGKNLADAFKSIGTEKGRSHVPAPQQLHENVDDSLKRALGRSVPQKSKKQQARQRVNSDKRVIDQAIALLKSGQAAQALGLLNEDHRKQRAPTDYHFTKALCLIELNDLHGAKGALEKELARDPDHHGAFKLLSELNNEIKALDKARQGDL